MPRALLACFTIVAAIQLQLAAAPAVVEEVPIDPPVAELAARYAIDPQRDAFRFMSEMARALYAVFEARPPEVLVRTAGRPQVAPAGAMPSVPVPLPASVWSSAIFKRQVLPEQLVSAILVDRRATLLCRGLSGLDDETLQYLIEHPAILSALYERASGVFGAFGEALRIQNGQVVTPGGAEFAPAWRAVVEELPTRPDRFIRQVFEEHDGRLAYLLDVVDTASPEARRFVLGSWLPEAQRVRRFRALFEHLKASYQEWHPGEHPFARPLGDLSMLLLRIRLAPSGAMAPPASRVFWQQVYDTAGDTESRSEEVDAAWLMSATGGDDMYTRLDRLDQIAFAQRMFARAADAPAAIEVLRPLRRYKMLPFTLERMGITSSAVYVASVRRAASLSDLSSERRFWTVAQYQGTLAFLLRARRIGLLSAEQATRLVASLAVVPLGSNGYGASVARWWQRELVPLLPEGPTWEARVIAALGGPPPATERRLFWEGQMYRIDLGFAEAQRLRMVREKQGGQTFDIAMTLASLRERLSREGVSLADVRDAQQQLDTIIVQAPERLRLPSVNLPPPGVAVPRDALVWVSEVAQRLRRIARPADVRRVDDVLDSLDALIEVVFGNVLMSFAYANELGDPGGAALLAGNVALRHDFGFNRKDSEGRIRMLWGQPRQEFQPGVPWHVAGSILSLDIGLAPLSLQRHSMERVADAPKLSSIEREALAVNVALLDPQRLTDADRDAVAHAIDTGRARVSAAAGSAAEARSLADELGLDGYRRRAIALSVAKGPDHVADQFTTVDLFMLGGGAVADVDAWGTPSLQSFGCACSRFTPSRAWSVLDGRLQLPLMAATMGDLNLTMAVMLRDIGVPTILLKSVLAFGMQEMIDSLGDRGDWWGISAAARSLQRQRVEDYVSAAAVVDGPLVPIDDDTSGSSPAH